MRSRFALQPLLLAQGQIVHTSSPKPPSPSPPYVPLVLGNCGGAGARAWAYSAVLGTVALNATTSVSSGRCASVLGFSTAAGAKVVAAGCHTTDVAPAHRNQEFDLVPASGGGAQLRNRVSDLCIGTTSDGQLVQVACGAPASGTVWQLPSGSQAAQWKLLDGRGLCVDGA